MKELFQIRLGQSWSRNPIRIHTGHKSAETVRFSGLEKSVRGVSLQKPKGCGDQEIIIDQPLGGLAAGARGLCR